MRYPENDRPNLPLPTTVPMFCLPMGCSLEKWPKSAQEPVPIFSTFVLTVSDAAEKVKKKVEVKRWYIDVQLLENYF